MNLMLVDVFTEVPFKGNGLGVVTGATSYSTADMQATARWLNLSETTFVEECRGNEYSVRIFSPQTTLQAKG